MSLDAVQIANAALMEVGRPAVVARAANGNVEVGRDRVTYRAGLLGALAQYGPDKSCKCYLCSFGRNPHCTTIGEALRGAECAS
jgi:hypothetical protein